MYHYTTAPNSRILQFTKQRDLLFSSLILLLCKLNGFWSTPLPNFLSVLGVPKQLFPKGVFPRLGAAAFNALAKVLIHDAENRAWPVILFSQVCKIPFSLVLRPGFSGLPRGMYSFIKYSPVMLFPLLSEKKSLMTKVNIYAASYSPSVSTAITSFRHGRHSQKAHGK